MRWDDELSDGDCTNHHNLRYFVNRRWRRAFRRRWWWPLVRRHHTCSRESGSECAFLCSPHVLSAHRGRQLRCLLQLQRSQIPLRLVLYLIQVEKAAIERLGPKLEVSRATKRLWQELQQEKVSTLARGNSNIVLQKKRWERPLRGKTHVLPSAPLSGPQAHPSTEAPFCMAPANASFRPFMRLNSDEHGKISLALSRIFLHASLTHRTSIACKTALEGLYVQATGEEYNPPQPVCAREMGALESFFEAMHGERVGNMSDHKGRRCWWCCWCCWCCWYCCHILLTELLTLAAWFVRVAVE